MDGDARRSLEIGRQPLQIRVVAAAQQRGMRGWRGSSAGVGRLLGLAGKSRIDACWPFTSAGKPRCKMPLPACPACPEELPMPPSLEPLQEIPTLSRALVPIKSSPGAQPASSMRLIQISLVRPCPSTPSPATTSDTPVGRRHPAHVKPQPRVQAERPWRTVEGALGLDGSAADRERRDLGTRYARSWFDMGSMSRMTSPHRSV